MKTMKVEEGRADPRAAKPEIRRRSYEDSCVKVKNHEGVADFHVVNSESPIKA